MSLQRILEEQFKRYKDVQIQDVYKLLYQAAFGPEHMITDGTAKRFYEEFERTEPKEGLLVEWISPIDYTCRINLGPYKLQGGSKEALFEWFYESAISKKKSIASFNLMWNTFKELNKEFKYFKLKDVEKFEKKYLCQDPLPAVHHSKKYMKSNKPSYLVVDYQIMLDDFDK
ncbi:hypothetical protein FJZ53_06410 [Candidatus Woesearchaeota archaeon]|nr:hypothetical protein [Candidatus Woesearchaeota archaeon]